METASNNTIVHLGTSGDGLKLFAVGEDGEVDSWNLPHIAAGLEELQLDWEESVPLRFPSRKPAALPQCTVEKSDALQDRVEPP